MREKTPYTILKDTFGYETFRPHQLEVIESILARRDTLAVMPTGGGKSLCYQIPALLLEGLTIVVSPLISLMKDQVEQLRESGVNAVVLNSSISRQEYQANIREVREGKAKLLYLAPETLLMTRTLELLSSLKVDLLTIDEAHCISEWGHDFRPEYRRGIEVREQLKNAVCLAMTATATPRVREDIRASLRLKSSNEIVASFNRENLFLEVLPKNDPLKQTETLLKRFKGQSGIIYCFSRRQVDELSTYLDLAGYSVRRYHAGLEDHERHQNQEAFIRDDVQIMVATVAFGMGINKPNVRFIIHYDLPRSIEGYYQEIGRAGRDGLPAHCLLLFSYADVTKLHYIINQKENAERKVAEMHLQSMVRFAEEEADCRRRPLLAYFGETIAAGNCGNCDNCTTAPAQTVDITIPAQKFLSCVKRTGERFGAGHIADVLTGEKGERIVKLRHDELSTYGIGSELSRDEWMGLARQLVKLGLLAQDPEYRTLKLTETAAEVLSRREIIMGSELQYRERMRTKPVKGSADLPEYSDELFELLRGKRKELADAAGIPPYVIFPDRTLVEMAGYLPQTEQSLMRINGVGSVKAERYGNEFLAVIRVYCRENNVAERRGGDSARGRSLLIGRAYNDGENLERLASRLRVKVRTLVDHLEEFVRAGNALQPRDDIRSLVKADMNDQADALKAFEELGTNLLKPVFERLEGRTSYDDLRILRILFLSNERGRD